MEEKGVHIYLDVIKNLSKKYSDWKFIIIGSSKLGYKSKSTYEKKILSNIAKTDNNIE